MNENTRPFLSQVFAAAMSAAPGQHHLIAVGNDSPQARLCDIRSGAFAHSLTGHSEAVWACAWSPRSEFLLATGSADQTVSGLVCWCAVIGVVGVCWYVGVCLVCWSVGAVDLL